jgi:hypothetical protein
MRVETRRAGPLGCLSNFFWYVTEYFQRHSKLFSTIASVGRSIAGIVQRAAGNPAGTRNTAPDCD